MCELILNTVSDLNFVKLLYGDDVCQDAEARASILLDLYLNTPDKGANETPLHFAVKYGALECVKVLTSYPECDRNLKNKHGKLPSMVSIDFFFFLFQLLNVLKKCISFLFAVLSRIYLSNVT